MAGYDDGRVACTDQEIRPVITPDDPERVSAELAAHGVNVTSGRESGLW
jgi:hypothetical protein